MGALELYGVLLDRFFKLRDRIGGEVRLNQAGLDVALVVGGRDLRVDLVGTEVVVREDGAVRERWDVVVERGSEERIEQACAEFALRVRGGPKA